MYLLAAVIFTGAVFFAGWLVCEGIIRLWTYFFGGID